jgi:mRNA interferase RelE/StbE
MTYVVELSPTAVRQLKKLDRQIQIRVFGRIEKLKSDPRPGTATILKGTDDTLYRVREGDYRIIYTIEDDQLIVLVIRIGHRSEVYRNL